MTSCATSVSEFSLKDGLRFGQGDGPRLSIKPTTANSRSLSETVRGFSKIVIHRLHNQENCSTKLWGSVPIEPQWELQPTFSMEEREF